MDRKHKLIGFYNYTVILTYVGVLLGFAGVLFAMNSRVMEAVVCLMLAGFCDMFDGTVASTRPRTEPEKNFGIQIDSLSDLICFGVLPAAITCAWGRRSIPVLAVSGLYLLCGLIRLAYFNVDEIERQKHSEEPREIYLGLPVTLSALFLPLVYGVSLLLCWFPAVSLSIALGIMAVLFLLPIRFRKPGLMGKLCAVIIGVGEVVLVAVAFLK